MIEPWNHHQIDAMFVNNHDSHSLEPCLCVSPRRRARSRVRRVFQSHTRTDLCIRVTAEESRVLIPSRVNMFTVQATQIVTTVRIDARLRARSFRRVTPTARARRARRATPRRSSEIAYLDDPERSRPTPRDARANGASRDEAARINTSRCAREANERED